MIYRFTSSIHSVFPAARKAVLTVKYTAEPASARFPKHLLDQNHTRLRVLS